MGHGCKYMSPYEPLPEQVMTERPGALPCLSELMLQTQNAKHACVLLRLTWISRNTTETSGLAIVISPRPISVKLIDVRLRHRLH